MTENKPDLLPCDCGKIPMVLKTEKPRPQRNIMGDEYTIRPYVSIRCRRHNGILIDSHAYGDTVEEAEILAIEQWNTRPAPLPANKAAALECWDKLTQSYLVQKVAVSNGGLADLLKHDETIRSALQTDDALVQALEMISKLKTNVEGWTGIKRDYKPSEYALGQDSMVKEIRDIADKALAAHSRK